MMPSVAVTGAGGFLGSAIVESLDASGVQVRALLGPPATPVHPTPANVVSMTCDITDVASLRRLFAGVQTVVHAAGPPSVLASLRDPIEFVRVHVLGTACVVEAMRAAGVSSIIYLSSAEVYGRPLDGDVRESHPLEARSPYGAAKIGAEAILRGAAASFGLRGYLLRPFSVYGPRMSQMSVLGSILAQARRGNVIAVADLAPIRDYCYVRDVADAVVLACACASTQMGALNVATGVPTSVGELVQAVGEILDRRLEIEVNASERRPRDTEVGRLVGSIAAIGSTLAWKPRYDLRRGLRETFAVVSVP